MRRFLRYFFSGVISVLIIISCSTEQKQEDAPIEIKDIYFNQVFNRAPKESDFQLELELEGVLSEENLKQDIYCNWIIEYLDIDIDDNYSHDLLLDNMDLVDQTEDLSLSSTENTDNYFLEKSKEQVQALLSVYQPGYYRITFQASNAKEIKEKSVIIQIGEPELPELYVRINIPEMEKLTAADYKGSLYLLINNGELIKNELIEMTSDQLRSGWANTGLKMNPFLSFTINAGSHVLKGQTSEVSTFYNDTNKAVNLRDFIKYKVSTEDMSHFIDNNPIVLQKFEEEIKFSLMKEGVQEWEEGEIFISLLTWGLNEEENDVFEYFEGSITGNEPKFDVALKNKDLTKIFVGSIGHRAQSSTYYIYFGPEGCNLEELDPNNKREYAGLPYGYLLGRFGENGAVFPLSNYYSYINPDLFKIYVQDEKNNFIPLTTPTEPETRVITN